MALSFTVSPRVAAYLQGGFACARGGGVNKCRPEDGGGGEEEGDVEGTWTAASCLVNMAGGSTHVASFTGLAAWYCVLCTQDWVQNTAAEESRPPGNHS
jgi:hypothetical protein